ncbi:hypothetical protein RFH42_02005 [Acinetobacter rudis]|uniref:hypothetical protein n=1 Tax=Acinetobacter rudis TaxID=632955 RepID=UPI00280D77BF|nr:hypothetical protein [Acinetobacter rudis]MDQ8951733.1 hypothetical protein [Acinetobacter rudis]
MSVKITQDFGGLNKLVKNVESFARKDSTTLGEIISEEFLKEHTCFESINDLFKKAGFDVQTEDDLKAVPQEELDIFVKKNTKFASFAELQQYAVSAFLRTQILSGFK